jgi:transposase
LASRRKTVERLEVMAGPTGRRSWPDAVKARIVVESFAAGVRVVDVARRHGVAPQQVTSWRRQARRGALALPAESPLDFATLVLDEPPAPPSVKVPAPIEIEVGGVTVRLAGDCPAARVAEIAIALRARA